MRLFSTTLQEAPHLRFKAPLSTAKNLYRSAGKLCTLLIGVLYPSGALAHPVPTVPLQHISKLVVRFAPKALSNLAYLRNARASSLLLTRAGRDRAQLQLYSQQAKNERALNQQIEELQSAVVSFHASSSKSSHVPVIGGRLYLRRLALLNSAIVKSATYGK